MLTTTNYKFKKPELTDSPPDITVMNGNWDIIDTNLKKMNDDKAPKDVATTSKDGLMSTTDKSKLDGIESRANNYTHPSKHPASIITEDATHRFLTDEERKLIQAWETFKASGGDIGGAITALGLNGPSSCAYAFGSGNLQLKNGEARIDFISGDGSKPPRLEPLTGGDYDLGDPAYYFKDVWVGPYSKNANGYSKLPNGLIIQWGVFTSNGINANAEISPTITLPINFPNRIGNVVPFVRKCVNESGATVNVEVIIKQVTIYTAGTYAIRLKAKEYVPGGVEVGYIAIGW